jgi:hypothetical protein
MMRKAFVMILLLGTAACSSGNDANSRGESPQNMTTEVSADESATSARAPQMPGISPTAAPGVAFNYRYAFRLAGDRISAVQEQHAAACEKLGIARCRITGMRYRLVGNRDIEGMIAFKLDPASAREFGKQGIAAVTRAEGMLVDAEIDGEDAGARIAAATRGEGQLGDEVKRVEAQLAKAKSGTERAELQVQAQQLRDQIRATRTEKSEQQESLATTPMVFNYGSGDLVPGFDGRSRIRLALDNAANNLVDGITWIFVALVTLLPWALLALLGWWGWRRLRVRLHEHGHAGTAPAAES